MPDTRAVSRVTLALSLASGLALAILIVAAGIAYASLQRLSAANWWVGHTQEARAELVQLLSAIQDAETAERGFVISGSPEYLAPYGSARRAIPARLARLAALTADNPTQERLLLELRDRVTAKLHEVHHTVRAREQAGFEAAQRILRSGRGKREMDRIRDLIGQMAGNEQALLAQRLREAQAASRAARLTFGLTALLAIVGLSVVYDLGRRQLRHAHALAEQRERTAEVETRLAAIVGSASDAIITIDDEQRIVLFNATAERMFGCRASEAMGRLLHRFIPAVLHERPGDPIRSGASVQEMGGERVLSAIRADGKEFPIEAQVSETSVGGQKLVTIIVRDVTERKRAEAALRAEEERSRTLLELNRAVMTNMAEGLYTVDAAGMVTFVNAAAERLFGWSAPELLGRRMHDVTHFKHPDGTPFPAEECAGLQVLRTGTPLADHEDVFIRRDGSFFPVVYGASRIVSGGVVAGLVVTFRDVTQQKAAAAEREQLLALAERAKAEAEAAAAAEHRAREVAEAASEAKDAFLATVSHELRTPLSPILAWARMLRQGHVEKEKADRALEVIERSARAQAQLVEDLLDVSRIVSGKLRLEVRPVTLVPVIERAVEIVRPAADAKGVRLQSVLDTEVGPVLGDAERLQQVVWNLLSNAVKFTPKGGRVQVVLERVNSHVEIAVSDTGQGIDPEFLPHVFERFQQADVGSSRTHGGLGLGLAIVRHLVEAHGGTVHAESPGVGKGAVFTVKLALMMTRVAGEAERRHPTAEVTAAGRRLPRLDGLRVLVVDDEPVSNEVVQALLASCGAEVRVAASAEQAREILGRWKADMVVSDVGMPGEDGYAFIGSLRAKGGEVAQMPAVALTAYASREDKIRLLSAGFQSHVPKPVDPAELVAVVANLGRSAGKL